MNAQPITDEDRLRQMVLAELDYHMAGWNGRTACDRALSFRGVTASLSHFGNI
jgi:hypothetical protein